MVCRKSVLAVMLLLGLILFPLTHVEAATFSVTPSNSQGWVIAPFGTPPPSSFSSTQAFTGNGSLHVPITVAASKLIFGRTQYYNTPLADLTQLTYHTFIDPTSGSTNNFYINLYVDNDGNGTYDERLDFTPGNNGGSVTGIWQQWDAAAAGSNWRIGGVTPTTLGAYKTANPNARINAFANPAYPAIAFNMGDTAANYVGFDGYIDNITINVTSVENNTYDFEPDPVLVGGGTGGQCVNDSRENPVCAEPWQTAAVYCFAGDIHVYGIGENSIGYLAFIIKADDIESLGAPTQNTMLESTRDGRIRVYRLTDGQFQLNSPIHDVIRGYLHNGYVFQWDGCI